MFKGKKSDAKAEEKSDVKVVREPLFYNGYDIARAVVVLEDAVRTGQIPTSGIGRPLLLITDADRFPSQDNLKRDDFRYQGHDTRFYPFTEITGKTEILDEHEVREETRKRIENTLTEARKRQASANAEVEALAKALGETQGTSV